MNRIFQIKVTIDHTEPLIWREFLMKEKTALKKLHQTIQVGFGWNNERPYLFEFKKQLIGNPLSLTDKNLYDDTGVYIGSLLEKTTDKLHYNYGLQNGWKLTIQLEKFIEDHNTLRASRCIGGERNGPPVACESHADFTKFLKELNAKASETLSFDPEHIDFTQINDSLERIELEGEEENI